MFSEGFLSKSECEQAKSKILNTSEKGITSCDNIKVYTAKKKSDEKTDVAKIEETKKEEYIRIKGKGSFEIVFNGYFVNI